MSNDADQPSSEPTKWHRLLAKLFELLLTPLGVIVRPEAFVMSEPPRIDILLLRRETKYWTDKQRAVLPTGVRDSQARDVLLEFKYTESLSLEAFYQAVGYIHFYRQSHRLSAEEAEIFVLSAKTPQKATLEKLEYEPTEQPGLYRSQNVYVRHIPLLVLNQLSDEPHNAYIKCFGSHRATKELAFAQLGKREFTQLPQLLRNFLTGLRQIWSITKGVEMSQGYTPEMVMEIGEKFLKGYVEALSPEERLAGIPPEERLAGIPLAGCRRKGGLWQIFTIWC